MAFSFSPFGFGQGGSLPQGTRERVQPIKSIQQMPPQSGQASPGWTTQGLYANSQYGPEGDHSPQAGWADEFAQKMGFQGDPFVQSSDPEAHEGPTLNQGFIDFAKNNGYTFGTRALNRNDAESGLFQNGNLVASNLHRNTLRGSGFDRAMETYLPVAIGAMGAAGASGLFGGGVGAAGGSVDAAMSQIVPGELGAAGAAGAGSGSLIASASPGMPQGVQLAQAGEVPGMADTVQRVNGLLNGGAASEVAPWAGAAADSQAASAALKYAPESMGIWTAPATNAAGSSGWMNAFKNILPFSLGGGGAGMGAGEMTGNAFADTLLKGALPVAGASLASRLINGSPPDYTSIFANAAQQQGQANLQAAQATAATNRVNTTTPYGSQKFTPVPDPSYPGGIRWESNIALSPKEQALYDADTANKTAMQGLTGSAQGRVADSLSSPFSLGGVGAPEKLLTGADAFSEDRGKVEQALMDRLTRLRKPMMDRDREMLDTKLKNQGLMPGTQAYDNAMRDLTSSQESELSDMADRAIGAGGAEQTRLQELSRANSGFNNQVRGQDIQELLLQRQQPLSELNALRTGNTPTLPTFQPFGMGSVAPAPVMQGLQNQYGAAADTYNAGVNNTQSMLNMLAKLYPFGFGGQG